MTGGVINLQAMAGKRRHTSESSEPQKLDTVGPNHFEFELAHFPSRREFSQRLDQRQWLPTRVRN
ncbi:hypothetical protein A5779_23695 [Mycolicibacterium peregrinum]|uniref:Uncharacterized protein n=2 Tax=Mycolicibacterium peregrinum TaxID=43304 RepID=A0A1A0W6L7_MYCPR|nr:hypothetical protein A5779_23695 [Mycolicibacterium peregrinum]